MSAIHNAAAPARAVTPDIHSQVAGLYNAGSTWLQTHWLQILIALGISAVIVAVLWVLRSLGHKLCNRDTAGTGWWTVVGRAVTRTGNFFIIMLAAKLVAGYANPPTEVATTITFLFTVAAVFQAAIWAREVILGAVEHKTRSEHYHGEALGSAMGIIRLLVTFALFAIALVVVLSNLGVNVSGLIAGLGVGGIAIGLAAQGIFADLFAALAIIFDRPFRRGDAITYDKSSGTVEGIGLKSTRIRGTSGEARIISNKNLLDKEIINNTTREYRRVIFTLGLVQTTPVSVLEKLPGMIKEEIEANGVKFVRAGFTTFGAQSYDFDVEFDTPSAAFQDMFDARHSVGLALIRRLNDESIALAYPTQTGLTAEEAGLKPAQTPTPSGKSEGRVAAPPSSGDRTAADQEGHG
ncbi:MAG: mechanosensitive ion channel family protein [Sphingomonas sp.]